MKLWTYTLLSLHVNHSAQWAQAPIKTSYLNNFRYNVAKKGNFNYERLFQQRNPNEVQVFPNSYHVGTAYGAEIQKEHVMNASHRWGDSFDG